MDQAKTKGKTNLPVITFEHKRDAYGFAVRPQHLQRYREYANIYKEEEEERSDRWKDFLERQAESAQVPVDGLDTKEDNAAVLRAQDTSEQGEESISGKDVGEADTQSGDKCSSFLTQTSLEKEIPVKEKRIHRVQTWTHIRSSLCAIEHMMSFRVKKKCGISKMDRVAGVGEHLAPIDEARPLKVTSEDDSEDEFYDVERSDPVQDAASGDGINASMYGSRISDGASTDPFFPWKEELESLVRGGVPMALRGEVKTKMNSLVVSGREVLKKWKPT